MDLTRTGTGITLICVPTVLATSGPQQYTRLAGALGDELAVAALTLPGFQPGQRLPATFDALVEAVAETVGERVAGGPFVVLGYSSGGPIARAVAARLERAAIFPEAVVLLDVHPLDQDNLVILAPALLDGLAGRLGGVIAADDQRLTAMGGYLGLLADRPAATPVKAPILHVRPVQAMASSPAAAGDDGVVVPGDHFSLIEDDVSGTSAAVLDWLSTVRSRRS